MAKIVEIVEGDGRLNIRGEWVSVSYSFKAVRDFRGKPTLVGSITGDPHTIREAFKCTAARLELCDGTEHSVDIVAHSEGRSTAYFARSASEARPGNAVYDQIRASVRD